jgi:methylated-DNA-[protein]-cysteine S-methyltransferase
VDLSWVTIEQQDVTEFDWSVYERARAIPAGTTSTYGAIAADLGDPTLARAVGQVLARNRYAIVVPCHRVLAAGGRIGGFSAARGVDTKIEMLAIEGVFVNATPHLFDAG